MNVLPALTFLATIVSVFFSVYTLNMFAMALMTAKRILREGGGDPDPPYPEDPPTITVQIPIYNEGPLVETVLDNVVALDYPKERLQIQILDDSTDEETIGREEWVVECFGKLGSDVQLIHRDTRKGFKAGALNNGLQSAKGDYIVVVDADTRSPNNFLKEMITHFGEDERLAFVQARCEYTDRWFNWITESNAIARDVHFLVEQPAKSWYNLMPNFSGKAGMWRREVLEKYPWDESVLTEDIELSYRVQMDGWRSLYLQYPTCQIELPPSMTALRTQQRRWTAGFAQSLRKLWWPLLTNRNLGVGQKLEALLFLSSPLTHLAVLAAVVLWILAAIMEPEATLDLWLGTFYFSSFLAFLSGAPHLAVVMGIARSGERRRRKALTIPLTLVMLTANLIANAKGAVEGLTRDDLVFERTVKHGITDDTSKGQIRSHYSLRSLLKRDIVELIAAALGFAATGVLLLKGQVTSALPIFFISLIWLIASTQE